VRGGDFFVHQRFDILVIDLLFLSANALKRTASSN
jgi:hypothetical protein